MDGLRVPANVQLSPMAERVLAILSHHTAFPWPVLMAQCQRCNLDPAQIGAAEVKQLAPLLSAGVARFTSPQKGAQVLAELNKLT